MLSTLPLTPAACSQFPLQRVVKGNPCQFIRAVFVCHGKKKTQAADCDVGRSRLENSENMFSYKSGTFRGDCNRIWMGNVEAVKCVMQLSEQVNWIIWWLRSKFPLGRCKCCSWRCLVAAGGGWCMIIQSGGIQSGRVPGSDGNWAGQNRLSVCVDTNTHAHTHTLFHFQKSYWARKKVSGERRDLRRKWDVIYELYIHSETMISFRGEPTHTPPFLPLLLTH